MAKILGSHKIMPGCFCNINSGKGLCVNVTMDIKWYGWLFLAWKAAHKHFEFSWYH